MLTPTGWIGLGYGFGVEQYERANFGPCQGNFRLYLTNSTKVNSLEVAKFVSMDKVELHGDILQPGDNLRPLVLLC